jgi:class 3 adenylate cyclase/predicted ATPase
MKFSAVVEQVLEMLQRQGRISYRALKREFDLDDEYVEDLKTEIIKAKRLAIDEDGEVLVWKGSTDKVETENRRNGESEKKQTAASDARLSTLDARRDASERRQMTVKFIDLVGSTTLSAQLDPEDYHARVVAYQAACHQVIARYAGHIAQYLGDGVLVYFGYPAAHEDDAVRAVRSGLEIVAAVGQLAYTPPLQVRIGIHTGPVMVGEIGAGERTERLALGETPNIAARVQGQAAPNTVVISAATYRLVQGLFECHDLGPQALKGLSTPLSLYRVVGKSGAQSRFAVAVQKGLTPLVGREPELGLLRAHWEQAKTGAGQVVLVGGDPGIGKSRLVQELTEQLKHEGVTRLEFRCSPYHQNSAFYPIIDRLQRLLQFDREDTPQAKLSKLQQALAQYRFPQADTLPLLAALLSLPHPQGCAPLTFSPQKQKQKTQEALVAWLREEAERNAVYNAWEDVHWADPSTLELLQLYLEQIPTTRVFTVLTFRPDFVPPWGSRSYLTQLTLSRLGRQQVETMVEKVTGGKSLPAEVVQQIVAKTDGVPLFVEELTKMVLESGLLKEEDGYYVGAHGGAPILPLAIPSTLQDSLMARLDRLASVKEIAQVGATLGREFSYELLHAVSPFDEAMLQQGLRQLVEAELIYQRGLPPQATYLFKHALIQDTAYQSLLKSKRRQLHQETAQVLEKRFTEIKDTQPELLAHHYTEAGLLAQAIPYWQQAGQNAIRRSANVEAVSHLSKGLELLKTLPDIPGHPQQELTLQLALAAPLMATKGWAHPEVARSYSRARELCQQVGETPQLFPALWGQWGFYFIGGELQTARELGEQLLRIAQNVQDPALLVEGHHALWPALFFLGEFALTRAHLEQGIALYDSQQHGSRAFFYGGHDPGVCCQDFWALILYFLGYPDQALKKVHEALTLARELSHPLSLAVTLYYAARLHQARRERQEAQEQAETLIALSREQEFALMLAWGIIYRGWALAEQGQVEEGIAQIRQGLTASQATGAEVARPHFLALLAESCGKGGQTEEGLSALTEALGIVHKNGEREYEAELYRLRGELMLAQSSVQRLASSVQKEAEECFLKAIEIARRQQAKSLELRAATSCARLWHQQGKPKEAHAMLAEIYNWFTEGFDTKDLQEAKTLLEELT